MVAGEYHLVTGVHTTPSGRVIPLGAACRQSLAAALEAEDIFTVTRQGLDYYPALFGIEYPFAKYDQVWVPEFSAGAMENVGCVTFTDRLLFRSRVTDAMYERRASVILHEMAHMWFGDLVTMKWFDDLWLNESFADYCAALASAEATRFTDAWTTFSAARKTWGYAQDQLPSSHPIAADVPTVTAAMANFDGISYAKGAAVLRQLVAYTGREAFFAGVGSYLTQHAFGNATLTDLLTALEASSGRPLADWSKAWLQTAGPNTLRPDFTVGADGCFTGFAVLQEAPAAFPALRPHHVSIGLYSLTGPDTARTLVRTARFFAEVTGARTNVPELTGVPQPDLVLLNDDDEGYALIRFDPRSLATVAASIGQLTDGLARAVCWAALLDMVRQAELAVPDFAAIVTGGIGGETSISVLQLLLAESSELIERFARPAQAPAVLGALAGECSRLLHAAAPGTDHQLAFAEALAWSATTSGQLDEVAGMRAGTMVVPGLVVGTELRWSLLGQLAAMGRATDADVDAELAADPTDGGRRHALACRAAMPDAGHKAAAWELLTGASPLGFETAMIVGRAFSRVAGAAAGPELLAPYVSRYFEMLPRIWAGRSEQFRLVLSHVLFPYWAASEELNAQVSAFLGTGNRNGGLVRALIECQDGSARIVRSRALPGVSETPIT